MEPERGGLIFSIQPYSVHDGPGIRTVVFFKGCPLDCLWCSNPEGLAARPQLQYRKDLCRPSCDQCTRDCSRSAVSLCAGQASFDFSRCDGCEDFNCVPACPSQAVQVCGYWIQPEALIEAVTRDRAFFGSDGGVTLSGGEPFAQPGFLLEVLERCRAVGIDVAVESCLCVPFTAIEPALPLLSFFMFDIKLFDGARHRRFCSAENGVIKENVTALAKYARIPLLPRMPVVPGINDDQDNIEKTAALLRNNGFRHVNLVPYMRLGIGKYRELGLTYELDQIALPSVENIRYVTKTFQQNGIICI